MSDSLKKAQVDSSKALARYGAAMKAHSGHGSGDEGQGSPVTQLALDWAKEALHKASNKVQEAKKEAQDE